MQASRPLAGAFILAIIAIVAIVVVVVAELGR